MQNAQIAAVLRDFAVSVRTEPPGHREPTFENYFSWTDRGSSRRISSRLRSKVKCSAR